MGAFKTNDIKTTAVIPANSTSIAELDAVMYDASDRLAPCTLTAMGAERFAGFAAVPWSSQIGLDKYQVADAFTTPASFASGSGVHRVTVLMEGHVVAIPIENTSGQEGDRVYLKTATSGAMIFTLTQRSAGQAQVWVGNLAKNFSGATANDKQHVVIRPCSRNTSDTDIEFWLNNHVEQGLLVGFDDTSKVSITAGGVFVGGRFLRKGAASNIDMAACASHATLARIALLMIGPLGTTIARDTGGIKFTFTAAGVTASTVAKNSWFWPTHSLAHGVVIGAVVFRSGSADLAASRVTTVRRSLQDVRFRKYFTGGRYSAGSPTLR